MRKLQISAAAVSLAAATIGSGCAAAYRASERDRAMIELHNQPRPASLGPTTMVLQVIPHIREPIEGDRTSSIYGANLWFTSKYGESRLPLSMGSRASWADSSRLVIEVVEDGGVSRVLPPLPGQQGERLLAYFMNGPDNLLEFDCTSFAHFIIGEPHKFGNFDRSRWDFEERTNRNAFAAGEMIVVGSSLEKLTHFAICIGEADGNPLFISKYGSDLLEDYNYKKTATAVTGLDEMQRYYNGSERVWVLRKKETQNQEAPPQ